VSNKPIFEAAGLGKRFGYLTALDDVTLAVAPGETLAIFGHNGAGKTTLLKIIATVIRTFSGAATIFDTELKHAGPDVRRRIGFVSHESFLYNGLTVRDNLIFYARLYGVPHAAHAADAMIERIDLRRKRSALVRELSRGMKQRVSIGRAFIHGPEFLLLDEPFTGLDERAADNLSALLEESQVRGGAAVMATHDLARGWKQANRVLILDGGGVAFECATDGTNYEDVRERYGRLLSR